MKDKTPKKENATNSEPKPKGPIAKKILIGATADQLELIEKIRKQTRQTKTDIIWQAVEGDPQFDPQIERMIAVYQERNKLERKAALRELLKLGAVYSASLP